MAKLSKPEQRMRDRRHAKAEAKAIAERAVREWPSMRHFNQGLRYIEIFAQLMKIGPFLEWMKANIEIHDKIDHEKKVLDVIVAYKGEGQLSPDEPKLELVPDVKEAAEEDAPPLCPPDPDPGFATGDNIAGAPPEPIRDPEQNIVCCPNCQLTFDANVEVSRISLATEIPKDAKIPGSE